MKEDGLFPVEVQIISLWIDDLSTQASKPKSGFSLSGRDGVLKENNMSFAQHVTKCDKSFCA
jgi:hypothetical protein